MDHHRFRAVEKKELTTKQQLHSGDFNVWRSTEVRNTDQIPEVREDQIKAFADDYFLDMRAEAENNNIRKGMRANPMNEQEFEHFRKYAEEKYEHLWTTFLDEMIEQVQEKGYTSF